MSSLCARREVQLGEFYFGFDCSACVAPFFAIWFIQFLTTVSWLASTTHRGNMTILQCDICKRNVYVRPQWFMIPGGLRGLHKSEVEVICPLSVHQEKRVTVATGFSTHTKFSRFSWKVQTFEQRLQDVAQQRRAKVLRAYNFIMECRDPLQAWIPQGWIEPCGTMLLRLCFIATLLVDPSVSALPVIEAHNRLEAVVFP